MHVYKELVQYKSVCDITSVIQVVPLPHSLGREQNMLGFSQVLKPIKWQDLLEVKNGCNEFQRGKKNILGQGVLELCYCLYNLLFYSNFFNILLLLTTQIILFVF